MLRAEICSQRSLLPLFIPIFLLLTDWLPLQTMAQPFYYYHFCWNTTENATTAHKYRANVANLLNTFSSYSSDLFDKKIINDIDNSAYGLYLCQGYVNQSSCQSCVSAASTKILRLCPNGASAVIWYDNCMIRYSDSNFFGEYRVLPAASGGNTVAVSDDPKEINKAQNLMLALIENATDRSYPFYAVGELKLSATKTRYGLVQCTIDLDFRGCRECLRWMVPKIPAYFAKRKGWWLVAPSCTMRYDVYNFYQLAESVSVANKQRDRNQRALTRSTILAIGITCGLAAIAILSCLIYNLQENNKKAREGLRENIPIALEDQCLTEGLRENIPIALEDQVQSSLMDVDRLMVPFIIIEHSTNHFSEQCKLGKGGFGPVYKGTLQDGRQIAVKRLSKTSNQGLEEYKNEVISIARLQHRNIVKLLGYCLEKNEKLLVYEYMPNASLDSHLFGKEKQRQLDWNVRRSIIVGITKGLLYLHEGSRLRIIHRDLKASNILLDQDMTPKISDFGLARIFGDQDQKQANTGRIVGTYGYIAPEYAMLGLFSTKSDVFSYGVLMLEIVSGKRNTGFYHSEDGLNLLTYAWRLWCEGNAMMLMDPVLEDSFKSNEVLRIIHIGLLCVQNDAANRPNMPSVVLMLSSNTITLPNPRQPAFSIGQMVMEQEPIMNNSKNCSINQVTNSNVTPR